MYLLSIFNLSICGLSTYIVYKILRNKDDNNQIGKYYRIDNEIFYEVEVPSENASLVIGKNGAKINEILELSQVFDLRKITNGKRVYFLIRSDSIMKCRHAKYLIERACERNIEETIYVVKRLLSSLIGFGGENIQYLYRLVNVYFKIPDQNNKRSSDLIPIVVRGTKENIKIAKYLLKLWLNRIEENRKEQLKQTKYEILSKNTSKNLSNYEVLQIGHEYEVEVVARIDPDLFYVRKSTISLKLQDMERQLNEYYSLLFNQNKHAIDSNRLSIGQLIVAQSHIDNKFYRARILTKEESKFVAFFLDHGDDETLENDNFFEIIPSFLEIPFQAIQCSLANVKPIGSCFWSVEVSDCFEEISQCGTNNYVSIHVINSIRQNKNFERFPKYSIDISYFHENNHLNVSKQLISKGFAIGCDELKDFSDNKTINEEHSLNDNEQISAAEESILVTPDIYSYLNDSDIQLVSTLNSKDIEHDKQLIENVSNTNYYSVSDDDTNKSVDGDKSSIINENVPNNSDKLYSNLKL